MPALSPSASRNACPRQMPTSSTVWCWSTSRSPAAVDRQVEGRVLGQQREHVVEKADAGGDLRLADAVEQQFQLDVGFRRFAVESGGAGHGMLDWSAARVDLSS